MKSIIAFIRAIDRILFEIARSIGPWFVPAAQGVLYGGSFQLGMADRFGHTLSTIGGLAAALCIIIGGYLTSHNAIERGGVSRWSLVFALGILEIAGLFFIGIDSVVPQIGMVTTVASIIVYVSQADSRSIVHEREREADHEQLAFERQLTLEQMRLDHERQMNRDKLTASVKRSEIKSVLPPTPKVEPPTMQQAPPNYRDRLKTLSDYGDELNPTEIMNLTGLGKTQAYDLIKYAVEAGDLHQIRRGRYQTNGKAVV